MIRIGGRGESVNKESCKCDNLRWFPLHARPNNTIPYIGAAVQNVRAGQPYSDFGWTRSS